MAKIQRIGAVVEVYDLEVTVHSVKFEAPADCQLQVSIKRGNRAKESTQSVSCSSGVGITFFNCSFQFRVSMYRKSVKYLPKSLSFRLVQISHGKSLKNGKARIDISGILNSSKNLERYDFPLRKATDKRASVCVSVSFARKMHSNSITSESTALSYEKDIKQKPILASEDFTPRSIGSTAVRHQSTERTQKPENFTNRLNRLKTLNENRIDELCESPIEENKESEYIIEQCREHLRRHTLISHLPSHYQPIDIREVDLDYENDEDFIISTPIQADTDQGLSIPPTHLNQVQPNTYSKGELIQQKEMSAGIVPNRKQGACNACLIY